MKRKPSLSSSWISLKKSPGYKKEMLEERIPDAYLPYITILEEPTLSISSTEIRQCILNNISIDGMVPEAVRDYIYQYNLYNDG